MLTSHTRRRIRRAATRAMSDAMADPTAQRVLDPPRSSRPRLRAATRSWTRSAPQEDDVALGSSSAVDQMTTGIRIAKTEVFAADEAPERWVADLAHQRLLRGGRSRTIGTMAEVVRYLEPALVPVAAAVWLHVLALTARAL